MKIDMNVLSRAIVGVVVASAAVAIGQMWFDLFSEAVFIKLLATFVILGLAAAFVAAVKQDISEEKKLKDDKYLD